MADMNYSECRSSDDHYWVSSDEMESHCRANPDFD